MRPRCVRLNRRAVGRGPSTPGACRPPV